MQSVSSHYRPLREGAYDRLIAIYQHEVSLNALNSETHGKLRRLEYVESLYSTWTHGYNCPARRGFFYLFEQSVPLFRGECF